MAKFAMQCSGIEVSGDLASCGGVLISNALTIRPDAADNSPRLRGIRQFSATILPAEKYPRLRRAHFTP